MGGQMVRCYWRMRYSVALCIMACCMYSHYYCEWNAGGYSATDICLVQEYGLRRYFECISGRLGGIIFHGDMGECYLYSIT